MSEQNQLAKKFCGGCIHLARFFGMYVCTAWDIGLKWDENHSVKRCKDCINHGVNSDQHED